MYERVNPFHPDKVADRIAGALVDMAYKLEDNPKIAVEVLIGHGWCNIIAETSVHLDKMAVADAVYRISECEGIIVQYNEFPQDVHLAHNQKDAIRCGDNGIFCGMPVSREQAQLTEIAWHLADKFKTDGKYILDGNKLIICQSHCNGTDEKEELLNCYPGAVINPLGPWTGGPDVDTGATNRKLGSDMGDAVTGGGLHGKDLSKADVSVNIYAHLKAQEENRPVHICCAIGDETVDGKPYSEIVEIARQYIFSIGGFESFAEWGLV